MSDEKLLEAYNIVYDDTGLESEIFDEDKELWAELLGDLLPKEKKMILYTKAFEGFMNNGQ